MEYLENYTTLWNEVTQNDGYNRFTGAGLNRREGYVQLVANNVFNSTNTAFRFHDISEKVYLDSIVDPEFLGTLQNIGFNTEELLEKVEDFKDYSSLRKVVNNVFSRSHVGPFFKVAGMYNLEVSHKDKDKVEEENRSLKGKRLSLREVMESIRIPPKFLTCYERYIFSKEFYAEVGTIGLHPIDANVIYRKFIETIERNMVGGLK